MHVVLLCGPPCAGKSTVAYQQAAPEDIVLDFDDYARALGSPVLWRHPEPYRSMAELEMQAAMSTVAQDHPAGTAWVIRLAPRPATRAALARQLGATVYLLDPGAETCRRRALAQQRPVGTRTAIGEWYRRYRPWTHDHLDGWTNRS